MQAVLISKFNGKTTRRIFIAIFAILSFIPVQSAAISVDPGDSIQAAIDEASQGGIIEVQSGTYFETLFLNKSLVLRGIDTGKGKPNLDAGGKRGAAILNSSGIIMEGFLVTNSSGPGIEIKAENNIIQFNEIMENDEGIALLGAMNNTIQSNTLENNTKSGISITQSSGNTIKENAVIGNGFGISLRFSNDNTLAGNRVEDNEAEGIYLSYSKENILIANIVSNNLKMGINLLRSENNVLRENEMLGNKYNFNSEGRNDIDSGNQVEGKPIYYLMGAENIEINSTSNAGNVYCINCTDVTIRDLVLAKNGVGIYLNNSSGSRIYNNQMVENIRGVQLLNSKNNYLEIAKANDNDYLLFIERSSDNALFIDKVNASHNKYSSYIDTFSEANNNTIKDLSTGPRKFFNCIIVPVNSNPSGAWIYLNDQNQSKKTPDNIRLIDLANANNTICLYKDGYRTYWKLLPDLTPFPDNELLKVDAILVPN